MVVPGKVLVLHFTLLNEVMMFLSDFAFDLSSRLSDPQWLQCLSYLADIFSALNELNLSLQGSCVTVLIAHDKIEAMLRKINFWESCVKKKILNTSLHCTIFCVN